MNQVGRGDESRAHRNFTIIRESTRFVNRFKLDARVFLMRVDEPRENTDVVSYLETVVRDIYDHIRSLSSSEHDFVGITIRSENFINNGDAGLSFRPIHSFLFADLWDLIAGLTQSNESFKIDESFTLEVIFIEVPTGRGSRKQITLNVINKRSMVKIQNKNESDCLPRALVVGESYIDLKKNETCEQKKIWKAIISYRCSTQKQLAAKLTREAGVVILRDGC